MDKNWRWPPPTFTLWLWITGKDAWRANKQEDTGVAIPRGMINIFHFFMSYVKERFKNVFAESFFQHRILSFLYVAQTYQDCAKRLREQVQGQDVHVEKLSEFFDSLNLISETR
jgi:hypothetical protein